MTEGELNPDAVRQAVELLSLISGLGGRIWVEGNDLRCSARPGVLDENLLSSLRAEKQTLMALLMASEVKQTPWVAPPGTSLPALTLAQEALLPLARIRRNEGVYNIPLALQVTGSLNPEALYVAANAMLARHDSLRSCFPSEATAPSLRPRAAAISAEDSQHEPLDPDAAVSVVREAIARPFDLEHGPLWRYCTYGFACDVTVLLFVFHHLVFDGFSRDVFVKEFIEYYEAAVDGVRLPRDPALQAGNFASWERARSTGPVAELARQRFRERFSEPCFPAALPLSAGATAPSSNMVSFSSDVGAGLRSRASSSRLPPAVLVFAAAVLALHSITGQTSVLAMVPFSNRDTPESLGIIGYLNRLLPVQLRLDPTASIATVMSDIARELSQTASYSLLPISEITNQPNLASIQLTRLMVSWQERRRRSRTLGGSGLTERSFGRADADFELALQFEADGDDIQLRIDSASGILNAEGQARFGRLIADTLSVIVRAEWNAEISQQLPGLISPPAINALLIRNPSVIDAAVDHEATTGLTTAWIVLEENNPISEIGLKEWLGEQLGGILPPIRFRPLAYLNRLPDGKVDYPALYRALPADDLPIEPPRTDVERLVADVWRKVLWLERPIGRNEDFRELGGHSLLAVRMIGELEATLGRSFRPSGITRLSTVADLAADIERPPEETQSAGDGSLESQIFSQLRIYTSSWKGERPFEGAVIVGRNLSGTRPPLFWCLQAEPELEQLAHYLGQDQPVYGMRSGYAIMVKSRENIDRLARHYAREIMASSPSGDILIGGNCQAAVIAFHTARHLMKAGREVALLFLHEKMIPERYAGRIALSFGRESSRNPYLVTSDPYADFSAYYSGVFTVDLVPGAHGEFFKEPNITDFASMIRSRRDEALAQAASSQRD